MLTRGQMMKSRFWLTLAFFCITLTLPGSAATVWWCTYRTDTGSPPFTVKVVIDEDAKQVNAFVSDYVYRPTQYTIVEDARFGLVGVLHDVVAQAPGRSPDLVLGTFFLDKESGASKRIEMHLRDDYEVRSSGKCKRRA